MHYFILTKERSIRYPAKTITDDDYADDIALLANVWFQGFLFNTDNNMVSSSYFLLIIEIYLDTVIWFQVINNP